MKEKRDLKDQSTTQKVFKKSTAKWKKNVWNVKRKVTVVHEIKNCLQRAEYLASFWKMFPVIHIDSDFPTHLCLGPGALIIGKIST